MNSLKQIGLAFHNYASATDTFPPAVLYGPDGKTPYSWRVAILPQLDQQTLYVRYNFNEPWDGPNNRKLIAEMPAVYSYNGESGNGNASFFVPTGPGTLFPGKEWIAPRRYHRRNLEHAHGRRGQRDIPWTKPEDIPYDAKKPPRRAGRIQPRGFQCPVRRRFGPFFEAWDSARTSSAPCSRGPGGSSSTPVN